MIYKKRPSEVRAIQFTGDNHEDVAEFCGTGLYYSYRDGYVRFDLKKGELFVLPTEYVLLEEGGSFTKLTEETFHKNYELA